ncbi:MAG: class I SAM-dependent methyltransferase [Candidatus Omnitrophica bacterium]|nr:class I SAM-dependent methyltransferase [Candidatus Omnitrophota bacterium]
MKLLKDVELYRDVRIGNIVYRGSEDSPGGEVGYIFDLFPVGYFEGKTVLDLGSAGGAICFEAARRGCAMTVGLELQKERIAGARRIQRLAGMTRVRFIRRDLYEFLERGAGRFDVIFALNLLHHLSNPLPLLQKICRSSKEYICLEGPWDLTVAPFREYCPRLAAMERGTTFATVGDYLRYFALMHFSVVGQAPSAAVKEFYLSDRSPRRVSLLRYARRLKDRDTRLWGMRLFQGYRDGCDRYVRADPYFLACHDVQELLASLKSRFNSGRWNFILVGPRASGKSVIYENLPALHKPTYHSKIFKFSNWLGMKGLRRHLHPTSQCHSKFAEVLLSTMDDGTAHVSQEEFLQVIKGRPVVCVVCYCGFEEHFERLYAREVRDFSTEYHDVYFDLSLRFDYLRWVEAFRQQGIPYVIAELAPMH